MVLHRRHQIGSFIGRNRVFVVVDQGVDFGGFEAGDFQVEREVQARQMLEFDRQDLRIPARIQRQLVVRDDIGALLLLAQVLDADARNNVKT